MSYKHTKIIRFLSLCLSFLLFFEQTGLAQGLPSALTTPLPTPPLLRYLSVNSSNPFNYFNFLLDKGNLKNEAPLEIATPLSAESSLTGQAKKLISYFFLGITLADKAFWVNLRPDEPGRITSEELSQTDLGKTLLEQDLKLKKDVSKLLHPHHPKGKEFWTKLYETIGKDKAKKEEITTSNRVWIVPDKAVVLETEDGALVVEAKLKVLLENEYFSNKKGLSPQLQSTSQTKGTVPEKKETENIQNLSESLMKEIILPEITNEINSSQAYAPLRQIYHSLILAQWFKRKYKASKQDIGKSGDQDLETGKSGDLAQNSLITQSLNLQIPIPQSPNNPYIEAIDKGYTKGLESETPWEKDTFYQQYLNSYSKGEYKLEANLFGLRRMYWSGGVSFMGEYSIANVLQTNSVAGSPLIKTELFQNMFPAITTGNAVSQQGVFPKTEITAAIPDKIIKGAPSPTGLSVKVQPKPTSAPLGLSEPAQVPISSSSPAVSEGGRRGRSKTIIRTRAQIEYACSLPTYREAAKWLDVKVATLYRLLKQHGLKSPWSWERSRPTRAEVKESWRGRTYQEASKFLGKSSHLLYDLSKQYKIPTSKTTNAIMRANKIKAALLRADTHREAGRMLSMLHPNSIYHLIRNYNLEDFAARTHLVNRIVVQEQRLKRLTDEELAKKTGEFRERLEDDARLDELYVEALAVVREAVRRHLGEKATKEQLFSALSLLQKMPVAVEQPSGEGKTLSLALAAYVRALEGRGVYVHTLNSSFALRDGRKMGRVFSALGFSVGIIQDKGEQPYYRGPGQAGVHSKLITTGRQAVYRTDITYGPYLEFIFDFLIDELEVRPQYKRQPSGGPGAVFVDEGDVPLLDEAQNPLILSQKGNIALTYTRYRLIYHFAKQMKEDEDYTLDQRTMGVSLRPEVMNKLHQFAKTQGWSVNQDFIEYVQEAIAAHMLYKHRIDYLIQDKTIKLLDRHSGRINKGQVWEGHLNNFVATKESEDFGQSIELIQLPLTVNMITPQSYYVMMADRLGVISATLAEDAEELEQVYGLRLVVVPPTPLIQREDIIIRVYLTKEQKRQAILKEVKALHETQEPVVLITRTIEEAEELFSNIHKFIPQARLLTAENENKERWVISEAGKPGAVTIATNMAGRGTDIELQEQEGATVLEVMGTEPHFQMRMDHQVRARAARWNRPGRSYFFGSLDDELFVHFAPQHATELKGRYADVKDGELPLHEAIEITEQAQVAAEEFAKAQREETLKFGNQLDGQRRKFFAEMELHKEVHEVINAGRKAWSSYLQQLQRLYRHQSQHNPQENQEQFEQMMRRTFYKNEKTNSIFTSSPMLNRTSSQLAQTESASLAVGRVTEIASNAGLEEIKGPGGIDLSTIDLTLSRQGILLEVGIPPSNKIGLAGKDEKFISSLNPADQQILLAAKYFKDGWESLTLLYIHQIMLFFKDNLIKDIQNKDLLSGILKQLQTKDFLDPQALQFFQFIQSQKPLSEIKVALTK